LRWTCWRSITCSSTSNTRSTPPPPPPDPPGCPYNDAAGLPPPPAAEPPPPPVDVIVEKTELEPARPSVCGLLDGPPGAGGPPAPTVIG
jgi:formin 2